MQSHPCPSGTHNEVGALSQGRGKGAEFYIELCLPVVSVGEGKKGTARGAVVDIARGSRNSSLCSSNLTPSPAGRRLTKKASSDRILIVVS